VPTLSSDLRKKLENTVVRARDIAEEGARLGLEALAVHESNAYDHMDNEQRRLRNHLRAHARQLGDHQQSGGKLDITHLVHEYAYEHWHRMLFASFLAENHLLIHPEMGVAVTLEECEELAKDGKTDKWHLASLLAQHMLPQIFRPEDPVLQVSLPKEYELKLERLLDNLDPETFTASDAIGWVYQFWQTKRKQEVNESGNKIGADELPAVTQLFTEDYMVDFMLDNTLGAWWVSRHKNEPSVYDFKYLRFKDDGSPMAGSFDGWPAKVAELKCLDPCCGSGHFLVALFERLVPMRMAEEGLSQTKAAYAVLRDNIYGLEIDPRCTQLAAFNLALAAWKLDPQSIPDPLPSLNIACCGLEIGSSREEWKALAPEHGFLMNQLYDLFSNASTYGSLIDPVNQAKTKHVGSPFHEIEEAIIRALDRTGNDFQVSELGVTAKGLTKAYKLLSDTYHLVVTNVPYLARGKQSNLLKEFIEAHYFEGKQDLATAFVERCWDFCYSGGTATLVTPQNWLFLESYKKLREKLLKNMRWVWVARLGANAFGAIGGEVVNVTMLCLDNFIPEEGHALIGLDVSQAKTIEGKASGLLKEKTKRIGQNGQLDNPDGRIQFGDDYRGVTLLNMHAYSAQGIGTTDNPRFVQQFWEQGNRSTEWEPFQTSSERQTNELISGHSSIFRWGGPGSSYFSHIAALKKENRIGGGWQAGRIAWGHRGIAVNVTKTKFISLYFGNKFDTTIGVVVPKNDSNIAALAAYLLDPSYVTNLLKIDQSLSVTEGTLIKVPFDLEYWQTVAHEKYPNGLPEPYSNDPTQWIFHGRPEVSESPLHVAVVRLMGYRWPAELDKDMRLSKEARELVRRCDDLLTFADQDGIVCIPSVRGEETAATSLRSLLKKAYGQNWHDTKEKELIQATGSAAPDLDTWLREDFFEQHCRLFHHRPFIWHIWDGRRRDGFHALIYYHKLAEGKGKGRKLLESLTYSYLGEWISRQKDGVKRGEGGAEDRLAAAMELQKRLIAIIAGEPPFDIFVRWKPLHEQPIGWEPDINDGVRLNIRPFLASDLPNGRNGAGILRWKPNINWNKDRGKEPERPQDDFPWFWDNGEFTGNRYNDIHLSIAEKQDARADRDLKMMMAKNK